MYLSDTIENIILTLHHSISIENTEGIRKNFLQNYYQGCNFWECMACDINDKEISMYRKVRLVKALVFPVKCDDVRL